MKEHKLPSGATLRLHLAPFEDSKNLYQAVLGEVKGLEFKADDDIDINFIKDILCSLLSSKEIEVKLWECMKKALYNDARITKDTFEPEEARQDYLECMSQVAWQNILPFGKALFASYEPVLQKLKEGLKLPSKETTL